MNVKVILEESDPTIQFRFSKEKKNTVFMIALQKPMTLIFARVDITSQKRSKSPFKDA